MIRDPVFIFSDFLYDTAIKMFLSLLPPIRIRGGWRGYVNAFYSFNITPLTPSYLKKGLFK